VAGFAAACYRRGTPFVLVPTTLLAMVDASISGKTGVDCGGLKNSVGAIRFPRHVQICIDALQTLPDAEFRSAFSEIIKLAITTNPQILEAVNHFNPERPRRNDGLLGLIHRTCLTKASLVSSGAKTRLHSLYGHVIGHALESMHYGRHGDCVAVGIEIEGYFSVELGLWNKHDWLVQRAALRRVGLATQLPATINVDALLDKMRQDRFASNAGAGFILPSAMGAVHEELGEPHTKIPWADISRLLESHRQL
jgi:3-dehydroquinate synthase